METDQKASESNKVGQPGAKFLHSRSSVEGVPPLLGTEADVKISKSSGADKQILINLNSRFVLVEADLRVIAGAVAENPQNRAKRDTRCVAETSRGERW